MQGYTTSATQASRQVPRRSVLFVPGFHARAIEKARQSSADCIVLDLEDMVPDDQKDAARLNVVAALAAGGFADREVIVRLNGLDTPWGAEDIAAIAPAGAGALLLPKIDSCAMLEDSLQRIDRDGGADAAIWILAETPRGVLDIDAIVRSSRRVKVIVMGTEDLRKSVGVRPDADRLGLLFALSRCVFAARAAGVGVVDGVYTSLNDEAGFAAACHQGAKLGFDGKAVIHPSQIDVANAAFN